MNANQALSRVCRSEIYCTRLLAYRALQGMSKFLKSNMPRDRPPRKGKVIRSPSSDIGLTNTLSDLRILLGLFDEVLEAEWHTKQDEIQLYSSAEDMEISGEEDAASQSKNRELSCDFCGADIFQSFFECQSCVPDAPLKSSLGTRTKKRSSNDYEDFFTETSEEEVETTTTASSSKQTQSTDRPGPYHICASCYVEGRSCICKAMVPLRRRSYLELLEKRNQATSIYNDALNLLKDGKESMDLEPLDKLTVK
jgi:hypothetical protein